MAAKKDEFSTKQINPKLGGERGSRRTPYGPTSSYDLVEQMEFLYVEVIQATHNSLNPRVPTCDPIVEITLGNYKSSTETLPIGPNMNWNQVFAFDKSKGDVLSVTLKDRKTNTEIRKRNFNLLKDIPTRVPPDARIAPQWYPMQNAEKGYQMELLMSIWFGTQADDVYPLAWFSDASEVSASCVIHTRPKIYLAPRLCYVRVTIVSADDLLPTDRTRTPSVYVTASLGIGKVPPLRTKVSSGTSPVWNQDLIFVASEPLEGTVYISLMDKIDEHHEECIGSLKKKLSEMKPLTTPGSATALFYDVEPPVKVEPAGDSRRFASRIKMKLATDQAYHVADECSEYASDYRAFAQALWPKQLGKLEIGILGATGLKGRDEKKRGIDSYVVAKYGNKWVRTRTVVDNLSPKWNEQYTFDVYEKSTVLTLGVYDNRQIFNKNQAKDVPIGKVRIQLSRVGWDMIYTCSYPILILGSSGLKKMGELQLAIRCCDQVADKYTRYSAPFRWMLPKAHYKFPLSVAQLDKLRIQAVEMNCLNLGKTEPPLRSEVVSDMLKPKNKNFSIRKTKANYERLCKMVHMFLRCFKFIASIRTTPEWKIFIFTYVHIVTEIEWKIGMCVVSGLLIFWEWYWIYLAVSLLIISKLGYYTFWEIGKFLKQKWISTPPPPPPPLMFIDLKLWKLEEINLDELAEEFDSFPSSETDINILRMRYDRLRKIMENLMLLMGDLARQGERVEALVRLLNHPLSLISLMVLGFLMLYSVYFAWDRLIFLQKCFLLMFIIWWFKFPCFRNDLPYGFMNFFRRLPTNEEILS